MMAVFFGCQFSVVSFVVQEPAFSTRERFWTVMSAPVIEEMAMEVMGKANRRGRRVRIVGARDSGFGTEGSLLKRYHDGVSYSTQVGANIWHNFFLGER